ncbi:hypothetical protein FLA4_07080 [Candidatus Rickettsia kotlanii]|nr:hypothetical protein FLA4_07080 [Candidatus Rickettsia kotlanii]BDU61541.1 hypothetical protein HM2_07090 [Candidatus Rickettsia kotlanii]
MYQAIKYQLSKPLLITLLSSIALDLTNIKVFVVISTFMAIDLPLALQFFTKLAKMEQDKQDA